MSRISLALPPGVVNNGTEYSTKGRYFDASMVRWYDDSFGPILGWRQRSTTLLTGAPRAALTWKDNSATSWLAVGTHSHLYVSNIFGTVSDITPSGFTVGRVDASGTVGYGSGNYGAGAFGVPGPGNSEILDATQWSLDHFGEDLVGVSPDDGIIYTWTLNPASIAVALTNAPTCSALVVTDEGFIFALGSTDPRTVSWCDQRAGTVWTPTTTNQAGDYPFQTAGRLMCGKPVQGGTVILTDQEAYLATYIQGTLVYGFPKIGTSCGAISRQSICGFDMKAFWMSPDCHFWQYNGYVQPVDCDVQDYIIRDINLLQASKIHMVHNSANFEIEVHYCSAASTEIDRCVIWNYHGKNGVPYWNIGRPARTCGVDKGAFQYPIQVDSVGTIYDHEVGLSYDGTFPYVTGGPIELGAGDNVMSVNGLIPDDLTVGDVTASFTGKFEPDGTEYDFGTYTLTEKTDLRFVARQVDVTFTGAFYTQWRVGDPRLDVSQSGGR